jgi:hypothetical protein
VLAPPRPSSMAPPNPLHPPAWPCRGLQGDAFIDMAPEGTSGVCGMYRVMIKSGLPAPPNRRGTPRPPPPPKKKAVARSPCMCPGRATNPTPRFFMPSLLLPPLRAAFSLAAVGWLSSTNQGPVPHAMRPVPLNPRPSFPAPQPAPLNPSPLAARRAFKICWSPLCLTYFAPAACTRRV